jgi:hypothetical protein
MPKTINLRGEQCPSLPIHGDPCELSTHQTSNRTHLCERSCIADGLRDEHGSDRETSCKVTTESVRIHNDD